MEYCEYFGVGVVRGAPGIASAIGMNSVPPGAGCRLEFAPDASRSCG